MRKTSALLLAFAAIALSSTPAARAAGSSEEEIANLYAETNQGAEAIKHYNNAIKVDSENGRLYYERGHTYYRMNQYIQAAPDYTRSLQLHYEPALNYERRAFCYLNSKQYQKGIDDCTAAIKADPRSRIAYFNRSKAYALLGETAKSKADKEKIRELDKNPRAKDFSDRCMAIHDPQGRIDLCTAALKLDPNNKDALLYMGNAYLVLENKAKAIACYDKLVALNPRNLVAHVDRGLCLQDCGRLADAQKDLTLVLDNAPECYKAYFWRGTCYVSEKKSAQALADLKRSEEIVKKLMASEQAAKSDFYRTTLGRFLVTTFAEEAQAYELIPDHKKAIEAMTFAVNESRQAPVMLAKFLAARAEIYKKAALPAEMRADIAAARAVNEKIEAIKRGPVIPPPPVSSLKPQPGAKEKSSETEKPIGPAD